MPALVVAVVVAVSVALVALPARPASAYSADERGPWMFWIPPTGGDSFTAVSQRITPRNLAPAIYWSTQWFWNGAPEGGYAGIQTDGWRGDGSIGPMALFSVWDATAATPGSGATCSAFGGEGSGLSCRMPFPVVAGDTYRTDIAATTVDGDGQWWHATITDETSGEVADLGQIAAPVGASMRMPANFVEYFGRTVGCDQYPVVVSDFAAPAVVPTGTNDSLPSTYRQATPRSCARARVFPNASSTTLQLGGPQPFLVPNVRAAPNARGEVALAWDAPVSSGDTPVASFVIQASGDDGVTWKAADTALGSAPGASITNLKTGNYRFRVAAVNAAGAGAWSDPTPTVPVDSTPTLALQSPAGPVSTKLSFPIAWAGTDAQGIHHYDVQRRVAPWNGTFGAWSNWRAATTSTHADEHGSYGKTYCYRARAVDTFGNVSAFTPQRCIVVPLRGDQLARSSSWTKVTQSVFGGVGYVTTTRNATMTRTRVYATQLYLVARRCGTCGTVNIRWNGGAVANVNLYAAATQPTQVFPIAGFNSLRKGTLTITVTSKTGVPVLIEGLAVGQA